MQIDIITKADLEEFRLRLLEDIKILMGGQPTEQKKWLRSAGKKDVEYIAGNFAKLAHKRGACFHESRKYSLLQI